MPNLLILDLTANVGGFEHQTADDIARAALAIGWTCDHERLSDTGELAELASKVALKSPDLVVLLAHGSGRGNVGHVCLGERHDLPALSSAATVGSIFPILRTSNVIAVVCDGASSGLWGLVKSGSTAEPTTGWLVASLESVDASEARVFTRAMLDSLHGGVDVEVALSAGRKAACDTAPNFRWNRLEPILIELNAGV